VTGPSPLTSPSFALMARLVLELSHVMPTEAAAAASTSIEWRVLRRTWLDALAHMGVSETMAREAAARCRAEVLRAVLADVKPRGEA
jgi:hypothetical protein